MTECMHFPSQNQKHEGNSQLLRLRSQPDEDLDIVAKLQTYQQSWYGCDTQVDAFKATSSKTSSHFAPGDTSRQV